MTIDKDGDIEFVGPMDDIIKSGGESISSVELKNPVIAHAAVSEPAAVGVPHEERSKRPSRRSFGARTPPSASPSSPRNSRRPLAVLTSGWWVPDEFVFVDELPRTATGNSDKQIIRERYGDRPR